MTYSFLLCSRLTNKETNNFVSRRTVEDGNQSLTGECFMSYLLFWGHFGSYITRYCHGSRREYSSMSQGSFGVKGHVGSWIIWGHELSASKTLRGQGSPELTCYLRSRVTWGRHNYLRSNTWRQRSPACSRDSSTTNTRSVFTTNWSRRLFQHAACMSVFPSYTRWIKPFNFLLGIYTWASWPCCLLQFVATDWNVSRPELTWVVLFLSKTFCHSPQGSDRSSWSHLRVRSSDMITLRSCTLLCPEA